MSDLDKVLNVIRHNYMVMKYEKSEPVYDLSAESIALVSGLSTKVVKELIETSDRINEALDITREVKDEYLRTAKPQPRDIRAATLEEAFG